MKRLCNHNSPQTFKCRDDLTCPYYEKGYYVRCHFNHKNYLPTIIKIQMQCIFVIYRLFERWKLFILRQLLKKTNLSKIILEDLIWKPKYPGSYIYNKINNNYLRGHY